MLKTQQQPSSTGRKSAFDLLMSKTQQKNKDTLLNEHASINDNIRQFIDQELDIILLEEENKLKKGFAELKHQSASNVDIKSLDYNLSNVDLSAYHVKQIDAKG